MYMYNIRTYGTCTLYNVNTFEYELHITNQLQLYNKILIIIIIIIIIILLLLLLFTSFASSELRNSANAQFL